MRQLSLETMGESAKRKGQRSDSGKVKIMRGNGRSTFELLNEKLKFDVEWRKKELELKEPELEIRLKERQAAEDERSRCEKSGERNIERSLEAIHIQLQQQNQLILQLIHQQQQQGNLINDLIKELKDKK